MNTKKYLYDEKYIERLREENRALREKNRLLEREIKQLREENRMLESELCIYLDEND